MANLVTRLQSVASRSAQAVIAPLRESVVPAVKSSYSELMAKNAQYVVRALLTPVRFFSLSLTGLVFR